MSIFLSYLLQLKRLSISGISTYDEIKLFKKDDFYIIDRFFFIPVLRLSEFMEQFDYSNYPQALSILEILSKTLKELHKQGYAYRILRPESVKIIQFIKIPPLPLNWCFCLGHMFLLSVSRNKLKRDKIMKFLN